MKRKSPSNFGVFVVAFLFLFTPAYIDFQELTEADLLSPGKKYEDPAVEDFSLEKQLNFTIASSPLSIFSLLGNGLPASLTSLTLQIPCFDHKSFILRC